MKFSLILLALEATMAAPVVHKFPKFLRKSPGVVDNEVVDLTAVKDGVIDISGGLPGALPKAPGAVDNKVVDLTAVTDDVIDISKDVPKATGIEDNQLIDLTAVTDGVIDLRRSK